MQNRSCLPVTFLSLLLFAACTVPRPADVVYENAVIWTGQTDSSFAEAMAIEGGKILFIGPADSIEGYTGPNTETIDLGGAFVVPGLIDNHTHFLDGGFQLGRVELRPVRSRSAFTERIRLAARDLPDGRWVLGGNWDHEAWGGELPTREWIDRHTPDHPVFVTRLDLHMGLANTAALERAGITAATPDPDGGTIVRDPRTGEPTGVLKDEAMNLVYAVIPPPTEAEQDEALERAMQHALSKGVTQVHDMGQWSHLATYRRAHARDALRLRIYSFVPLATWQRLDSLVEAEGRGDAMLRWGGLKGFVDGSLGSTTAWFYEPYTDEPETAGLLVTDTTALRRRILRADNAGLQVAVHAIGDRANDWLLDVFAEAADQNGDRDRRFRIEHAQHLSRSAIRRFAGQGVIPSAQPYHAIDDGRWAEKRIGPERIQTTYPFRSLLDADAPLTFGSDWTVAPIDPLLGIYAAVTRRTIDGANPNGWVPEEKITVAEALRAYTRHNAYAGFQDDSLGTLERGKWADFVVLNRNLFDVRPASIDDVEVLRTVIAGVVRYEQ